MKVKPGKRDLALTLRVTAGKRSRTVVVPVAR